MGGLATIVTGTLEKKTSAADLGAAGALDASLKKKQIRFNPNELWLW